MFKRTWIVILAVMALGLVLSACGGGDLAEDLTPIPTLPPGEEPELIAALQATQEIEVASEDDAASGEDMSDDELIALGEEVFAQCESCHGAQDSAGPAFPGMADRAATRVEGMSAEVYLHESIVEPSAHVVEGFSDIMPADYDDSLSEQEINGLVAYIMAESSEGEPEADATEDPDATEEPDAEATEEPADEDAESEATEEPAAADETEDADTEDADEDETESDEGDAAAVEGDVSAGEELFVQNCASCHGAEAGVGPSLPEMAENAGDRVEDMSVEDYLHESIVEPGAHIVEGYQNIMPPGYGDQFDEQQLQDIIAYIMAQ